MSYHAEIVADSINPWGERLTTFSVRYPRYIHSEVMTHRQFSRNASSSRAIPVERFVAWVQEDPAMPLEYRQNQRGMQGGTFMSPEDQAACEADILALRDHSIEVVKRLSERGLHKQNANRYLEPWHHISVLISATNFANFFSLRIHPDAQPEVRETALHMLQAYRASSPKPLVRGEWHLPYVGRNPMDTLLSTENQRKVSVARCARVSYNNHDGSAPDPIRDVTLHDDLVGKAPLHASPAEHQAVVSQETGDGGNFGGHWKQYRKTLPQEVVHEIPAYCFEMLEARFPASATEAPASPNHVA